MYTALTCHRLGHEDNNTHISECGKHTATRFDVKLEEEKRKMTKHQQRNVH